MGREEAEGQAEEAGGADGSAGGDADGSVAGRLGSRGAMEGDGGGDGAVNWLGPTWVIFGGWAKVRAINYFKKLLKIKIIFKF